MTLRARQEFWQWFEQEVHPSLDRLELPQDEVIEDLDGRMASFGLSWELGPAPDGTEGWAFAVSFGADLDRIAAADRLVNVAPTLSRCQVVLGKPPKRWNGVLNLPTGNEWVQFSTANWWCHILPLAGGMAIMVSPTEVGDVDEELVSLAVAIAVQSELGELRFAQQVHDLSVVDPDRMEGLAGIRCRMHELGFSRSDP